MTAPIEEPKQDSNLFEALLYGGMIVLILGLVIAAAIFGGNDGQPDPDPTTTSTTEPTTTTSLPKPTTTTNGTTTSVSVPGPDNIRLSENPAGLGNYTSYDDLSKEEVSNRGVDAWTVSNPFNPGSHPQGQFRLSCTPSHFAFDDPIIAPNEPNGSHLHMFFGNTLTNSNTTAESLLNNGSSSCQGGAANRSAYWMPALLDADNNLLIPELITLYYKGYRPWEAQALPQGVEMLSGAFSGTATPDRSFVAREWLHWGCNNGSQAINIQNVIPGTNGTAPCSSGHTIQATIQFPQCFAVDSSGDPILSSDDHLSHMHLLGRDDGLWYGNQNAPCPSTHPYRVPQISYLVKWKNPNNSSIQGWHLASDYKTEDGDVLFPGGSLHADWFGGWADVAIDSWIEGCFETARNCPLGLNGQGVQFTRLAGTHIRNDEYTGPQTVPCGEPCSMGHHGS